MAQIEFTGDGAQVDADFLARAFDLSTEALRRGMRDGAITSRFETGEGKDAGRVRLSFFSSSRRVQFVADESGRVLTCVTTPLPRPRAGRKDAGQDQRKTRR
ncbi:hypothetical protein U879_07095 [Defluviimonas sp. 20V17]|uniref:Uncharacterized protein n=1 Tax=Allgaiera indica TaxID=765699 RepID=A0AAN4UVB8_9RHOB|nr:DUF6522 family protein [Allgaiera indica]KDB04371.1 hypothetical protein U879_07095 [Defluviimonas sp. 20V17]GHE06063.1 hypothetical protein GCM10008024_39230 [Allgaiera indica]SDX84103.1 hypothetical protein SAMN05444006_13315 [Allgaiera indica]